MPAAAFKIVLVGNESVGKTSLVRRFVDNTFSEKYISTLGFQVFHKELPIDGYAVDLELWDLAGEQKFDFARKNYYAQSNGFLLVFDLTDYTSFQDVEKWYDEIQATCPGKPFVLVGNKADLPHPRINKRDITRKGKRLNAAGRILTSAKTGGNVKEAYELLGQTILKSLKLG